MADFATVADVESLCRLMDDSECTRAGNLLPVISDSLRYEASRRGYDLDSMIEESASYGNVVKTVTVDICVRAIKQNTQAT